MYRKKRKGVPPVKREIPRLQQLAFGWSDRLKKVYKLTDRQKIHVLGMVASTNDVCRRMAAQGAPDGTVVLAEGQTAGRGRRGRSFQSAKGQGLYLSILWRPDCPAAELLPLTALGAVAACRAVGRVSCFQPGIKWPNDLTLAGGKLAGILTETQLAADGSVEYVVLGIGINVHQKPEEFPEELRSLATALDRHQTEPVSRPALAVELIDQLDQLRSEVLVQPQLWLEEYRRRCIHVGRPIWLLGPEGQRRQVTVLGIDEQFGLQVQYEDGRQESIRSGEISVRGMEGYL